MTAEEFTSNAIAIVGTALGWQSEIARRLGVDPNSIRKAAKHGPSDSLARALLDLIGTPEPQTAHARWICGEGDDGREYLIHTRFPRFRCLIVAEGDDFDLAADDSGAFHIGDGQWLAAFHWQDKRPDGLAQLMDAAADAVARFA